MKNELLNNNIEQINHPYKKIINQKDAKFELLKVQIVLCVLALLFVFSLKLIGGDVYSYSFSVFKENFDKPIDINQVLSPEIKTPSEPGAGGTVHSDSLPFFLRFEDIGEIKNADISQINSMVVPVNGRISSRYERRINPVTGEHEMHAGLDIAAEYGSDIKAAMDGVVLRVDYEQGGFGNFIELAHENGITTVYAHCSKIILNEGDRVKKGDIIAKVGSTGRSTGPHLHFEVRIGEIRINPEWLI